MRALVVYESMYGNTHEIAEAIAEGLRGAGWTAETAPVAEASAERVAAADLLCLGGPTHVHGMTRPRTRDAAREAAGKDDELHLEPGADGPGAREWLEALAPIDGAAAAFDTRVDGPALLTGRASHAIDHRLRAHGFATRPPESFLVDRHHAVLLPGERERAVAWGRQLASTLAAPTWSR
jgi:hypothetical protein